MLNGRLSEPFGAFRGNAQGQDLVSAHYTLVHLPTRRILATLRTYHQCKSLASELAPAILRGELPDPLPIVERYRRESV